MQLSGSRCGCGERTSTTKGPLFFEEFFDMGLEESSSPFLTRRSRHWGYNLPLKTSLLSAFLLVVAFAFSWSPSLLPLSNLALVAVYFFVGAPAIIEAFEDLIAFHINIDVLMTVAAFSSVLIGSGLEGGLLLVLFAIAGAMEEAVTAKAKGTINTLSKLAPTKATVIDAEGLLIETAVSDITVGTKILIKAGEMVPLDGDIIEGASSVNLIHLTGESLPITKKQGDNVAAGAQNLEGSLVIQVTKTSGDSTLARIIQLVTEAQEAKPQLQRWFDKMSRGYATSIIALSAILGLTMPFFLNIGFFGNEGSFYRSLAFLIACSPCALIIAIPVAYLSAISACAKTGILIKGGVTLDDLANCGAIAFDKTGTLTTGKLHCREITSVRKTTKKKMAQALKSAIALERNAIHPIALAISAYGKENNIAPATIEGFKATPGYGLEAIADFEGEKLPVAIGHAEFIADMAGDPLASELLKESEKIKQEGLLLAALLIEDEVFLFQFEDQPRPKIRRTLQALKSKYGLRLVMLTGDHHENAMRVAKELHLDDYYANLRPDDKLKYVSDIAEKEGLAMVGDGINDAPALARATVGISLGQVGSNAAIEAADIILLQDNIELMDWLVGKAHKTQRIVRENLIIAASAIIFTSIPAISGFIPLWLAVVLHEGGTVLVGLNALRLLGGKKDF